MVFRQYPGVILGMMEENAFKAKLLKLSGYCIQGQRLSYANGLDSAVF